MYCGGLVKVVTIQVSLYEYIESSVAGLCVMTRGICCRGTRHHTQQHNGAAISQASEW